MPAMPHVLVSVVHAAVPDHDGTRDPCGHAQSELLPESLVTSSGFAASGRQADVSDVYNHPRPCQDLWPLLLLRVMSGLVVLNQLRVVLMSISVLPSKPTGMSMVSPAS